MLFPLAYIFALSVTLLGITIAGLASERHFIVLMLGITITLMSSTIALVAFFEYNSSAPNPGAIVMLISIWAVAAVEVITLMAFYMYMKHRGADFDVSRLSQMKW
ncbi:MAG: hypothetical protein QXF01_00565 [Candidatus Micrarchaeaceae archaeon]